MSAIPPNVATHSTYSVYFSCRPVRASKVNPDGSPALINECSLDEAQWIGVYRTNSNHETTGENPSDWIFDLPVETADHERAMKIGQGLVELLNRVTPAEAMNNPNFHVFFE